MKTLILLLITLPSLSDAKGPKSDDFADSIYPGEPIPLPHPACRQQQDEWNQKL